MNKKEMNQQLNMIRQTLEVSNNMIKGVEDSLVKRQAAELRFLKILLFQFFVLAALILLAIVRIK